MEEAVVCGNKEESKCVAHGNKEETEGRGLSLDSSYLTVVRGEEKEEVK